MAHFGPVPIVGVVHRWYMNHMTHPSRLTSTIIQHHVVGYESQKLYSIRHVTGYYPVECNYCGSAENRGYPSIAQILYVVCFHNQYYY